MKNALTEEGDRIITSEIEIPAGVEVEDCVAPNGTKYQKVMVPKRDLFDQTILIFSVNIELMRMQRDMLKSAGLRNIEVSSSIDDFSQLCRERSLGTILINENPNLDPRKLIPILRNNKKVRDPFAQILFVTASCSEAVVRSTIRFGYDGVLCLPFSKARLWKTVEKLSLSQRVFVRVGSYFGPDRRSGTPSKQIKVERRQGEGAQEKAS